jgi:DNA-directed RNA polymerase subunit RPC12/RpoP
MSEFKFACPVCGQHITADSDDTGSPMECPTCFRKIVVPQAPSSSDPRLILSAAEAGKPRPTQASDTPQLEPPQRTPVRTSTRVALMVLVVLLCAGGATLFVFWGNIFHSNGKHPAPGGGPAADPLAALSSTNNVTWSLDLTDATFPDTLAAGRIHGQGFACQKAILHGGILTLRQSRSDLPDVRVFLYLRPMYAEELRGKSMNVTTNDTAPTRVGIRWNDGREKTETFTNGYALKLEFGEPAERRLPGKIYLCLPDEAKSRVAGTFNAEIRDRPPQRPPQPAPR